MLGAVPAPPLLGPEERVCVVIPAYRVERHIQDVVRGVPPWIWRIVVVDDASPDQTAERVRELSDPRVVLIRHQQNQGVGGAMQTGYRTARDLGATVMVKIDGDGQMSPEHLPAIVWPILEGRADYVKGNRFADASAIRQMPRARRIGNVGLSFLTKMASGYWNLFDPTNGYTALDADVARALDWSRIHQGYFFETAMLIELNTLRAATVDVPVPASYGDEASSLSLRRTLVGFPYLLISRFFRRVWLQYFVLDFSVASLFVIVGFGLLAFASAWGGVAWARSIRTGIPATTGTVMIADLPWILGFQLLLQAVVFDVQRGPRLC